MKCLISLVSLVAVLLVLTPRTAYAYLDPASGSMILQVIVAAVAAGLIMFKAFWHKIRGMFGPRRPEAVDNDEQETDLK
ncbi:MAG: hypothetical protein DRJ61_01370 [Acidobacteria bacterium]|nr:MAG: hypothetical protein DRJ61_01370 [Acidobacteriota bacterium]